MAVHHRYTSCICTVGSKAGYHVEMPRAEKANRVDKGFLRHEQVACKPGRQCYLHVACVSVGFDGVQGAAKPTVEGGQKLYLAVESSG